MAEKGREWRQRGKQRIGSTLYISMCSHHVTRKTRCNEKSPVIQPVIAFGRFGLWFGGLVDPWLRWVSKEGGLGGKGTEIRGYGSCTLFRALKRKMI